MTVSWWEMPTQDSLEVSTRIQNPPSKCIALEVEQTFAAGQEIELSFKHHGLISLTITPARIDRMTPPKSHGTLDFEPHLTPKDMLELGVFGGWYFEGNYDDLPSDWLTKAKLSPDRFDVSCNYFRISSGQSRQTLQAKGWISLDDPLGWFQWYCRYFLGRRLPDVDNYQIARWRAFGPRHIGGLKKNCESGNIWCRPRQRQALLQWAYDPFF